MNTKKIQQLHKRAQEYMRQHTDLQYHNFEHAQEVKNRVKQLIETNKQLAEKTHTITEQEEEQLICAALTHDLIIQDAGDDRGETASAQLAGQYLTDLGYGNEFIEHVQQLIIATTMGRQPQTYAEKIIKDADMGNLGSEEFWVRNEQIREEHTDARQTEQEWNTHTYKLLDNHQWHTKEAELLWSEQLKKNVESAKNKLQEYA